MTGFASRPLKLALVAGEASGDMLGAGLIQAIRDRHPNAVFAGIAGPQMQAAGCEAWWPAEELAVMGLFEVLTDLPRLLRLRRQLTERIIRYRPDGFIGIDAPDFNLGLEARLKRNGIRTVHYVSPSVWAWRQRRVKKIARAVDLILALFPFEPDFYAAHQIDARFVGHPMADEIAEENDPLAARRELGLDTEGPVVALLPGSRRAEVSRLAQPMLQAAQQLAGQRPGIRFIAALANRKTEALFKAAAHSELPVTTGIGNARQVLAACDAAIIASGTATLEALLVNRPMVVCYKLAPATHWLAKTFRLIKTDHVALPNILAGEGLVPELLQQRATPAAIAAAAQQWLEQHERVQALSERFRQIHRQLRRDASRQAAAAVLEHVGRDA